MQSRAEVTTRYARAYLKASKKDKGRVLDEVVSVTGWSRDNARRRLVEAAKRPPAAGRQVATQQRKPRASKFCYDTLKVLQKVWAASGGQCGKYLAASMRTQLDGLERHGELIDGVDRYSPAVREELLSMSAASIDRYLRPAKATDQIKGVATTKPSPLLRSSIKIRKAGTRGGLENRTGLHPSRVRIPCPALVIENHLIEQGDSRFHFGSQARAVSLWADGVGKPPL